MVTMLVLFLLLAGDMSSTVHCHLTDFHVIQRNMTQTEAQEACRKNYIDLVTVYSNKDNTELMNLMMNYNNISGWIGLKSKTEKWSNGDPVTYRELTADCTSWKYCTAMKADSAWESLNCSLEKGFMCYKQDACSLKYHLVHLTLNWSDAQSYCRKNYTDLVSIRNQSQNNYVKSVGSNFSKPFWIGLLCDDWQWSDGGKSEYRNWGTQASSDNCVILKGEKWSSESCSNNHAALCYCTSIHVSDEVMSWEKALGYCNEQNRLGILKISSEGEQNNLMSELQRRNISEPVWVGLRQSLLFGFWVWADGNVVFPYSNWDGGKQPEHLISENCGVVDPQKDYRWTDMNCLSPYKALCHIKGCP